jgi:DEAD/DEAH box helicase domain-containing protein
MNLDQLLDRLSRSADFAPYVTAWRFTPPRPPVYGEWPAQLDARLRQALQARGISRLYAHQATAVEAALSGRDVTVVTSTASGKTLCYNLPVLQAVLATGSSRALYLFPTKALSQDQYAELHALISALGADVKTYTYDGDTPVAARRAIRLAGHIVITNPDMLHTGVLPHHTKWQRLFENLRYVVVDELHHYRGIFGSHVANVLRRLARICEFYGSRPQVICCSATIANPIELARRLTGRDTLLVDNDGAARGARHFIFYNPPAINRELGLRRSAIGEAARIAGELIANNVQTIVFARSRVSTEVLLSALRERTRLPDGAIRGYRGGYLPRQRREIEQGLRRGDVRGVVATNALELGIDVGQLEAAILCGYPGTIASTWQQAGRAGRRASTALAVLVAETSSSSPTPTTSSSAPPRAPWSTPITSWSRPATCSAPPSSCPSATASATASRTPQRPATPSSSWSRSGPCSATATPGTGPAWTFPRSASACGPRSGRTWSLSTSPAPSRR